MKNFVLFVKKSCVTYRDRRFWMLVRVAVAVFPFPIPTPDNISLRRSAVCRRMNTITPCGGDHYDLHSHIRQFFICVFHLSFVRIVSPRRPTSNSENGRIPTAFFPKNASLEVLVHNNDAILAQISGDVFVRGIRTNGRFSSKTRRMKGIRTRYFKYCWELVWVHSWQFSTRAGALPALTRSSHACQNRTDTFVRFV
jgi:hypothetical protein